MEHKNFSSEVKVIEDGVIEALVAVFNNVDKAGEKILPGFFLESLEKKLPRGVWGHDWLQPVARTLEARETEAGLYIKAQFNLETQRGREAFSDIKFGIIDEFSIGYHVLRDSVKGAVRILEKGEVYEWSPVLVGANSKTELISIKSNGEKEMDEDRFAELLERLEAAIGNLESLSTAEDTVEEVEDKAFEYEKIRAHTLVN